MLTVCDIILKKKLKGKIDRSTSITKYKCDDIVEMFHGMYPHMTSKNTSTNVCLSVFVNF